MFPKSNATDAETLPVQFRRERLQRLVTQTQNCRIDPNYVNNVQGGVLQRTWRRKVAEWLLEFVDEFGLPNDIVAGTFEIKIVFFECIITYIQFCNLCVTNIYFLTLSSLYNTNCYFFIFFF